MKKLFVLLLICWTQTASAQKPLELSLNLAALTEKVMLPVELPNGTLVFGKARLIQKRLSLDADNLFSVYVGAGGTAAFSKPGLGSNANWQKTASLAFAAGAEVNIIGTLIGIAINDGEPYIFGDGDRLTVTLPTHLDVAWYPGFTYQNSTSDGPVMYHPGRKATFRFGQSAMVTAQAAERWSALFRIGVFSISGKAQLNLGLGLGYRLTR